MIKRTLILFPAYGRKYATTADALHAWESGRDFKIQNGPYCSIRNMQAIAMDFDTSVIISGNQAISIF